MGVISVSLPSDGSTADVADYNTPINTIVNAINGNLDNANIVSGAAIATSKLADDAGITAAKLASASVTSPKLSLTGSQTASVATDQGTTSTSYTDLSTTGPAVTVTVNASGLLLVGVGCKTNSNAQGEDYMSYAMSGANTIAAADTYAYEAVSFVAGAANRGSKVYLHSGLTPGSTTVTAKYRTNTSTGNFSDRQIWAIPL